MKHRNTSIDILKFIAVLAVTNSHMELLYGKYGALATGGAIGDALFFFASGFTILLGGVKSFGNYYKRRINRIYPTVFAWAVMSALLFNSERTFMDILLFGGGWFVSCIMIYYIMLFLIRKYFLARLKTVYAVSLLVSAALYVPFSEGDGYNMYGDTYYKWLHYFIFMLQGAIMGIYSTRNVVAVKSGRAEILKALMCVIAFYVLCAFRLSERLGFIQVLSLLPLSGITYYIYMWCNSKGIRGLYNNTRMGWCMNVIGGLCLETYLVQSSLFTDKLNFIFPLNIPVIFLEILTAAYILRCAARAWSQTFKEADYQWKDIFRLV